ncbi:MAG: type 4a pilus biogenesis protein PilO [Lacunisphaera sp.]
MNATLQDFLTFARRAPFLVCCVVALITFSIADYYLWQREREINAQHEEVRRNGEKMFSALSSHGRISVELQSVNNALKQIDDNLIAETDLAENIGYFYQLETLSRVHLTQLNQLSSQPLEDTAYKAIPFSMRATGTYPQLISFLRELESGPRQARIRTFNFTRADAKTNALTLGLTVELLGSP